MAWIVMGIITGLALCVRATGYKERPGRFQALAEMIIEELAIFFNSILHDEKQTRRVFPLVGTIFLFILLANWMGILPGVGSITIMSEHEGHAMAVPLLRSMNADVNMTLAIATISMITVQVMGIATLGIVAYGSKFFIAPWKDFFGSFVGILELVSEFSRLVSFTFRLFGNIFAGEVLLVVIAFLVPYIAPIPFLGLEIFVGFVQALVFAMLTLVFLKMATIGHGDHGAETHSHAS
jgi:F-type H+-transporting ATPase subunit a